jgi:hypothetical protein
VRRAAKVIAERTDSEGAAADVVEVVAERGEPPTWRA